MFALCLLINEKMITSAKVDILKKQAANLTTQDANTMMEVSVVFPRELAII